MAKAPKRRSVLNRVLVLYRKSTYETMALERRDSAFLDLLERKDPTVRMMETVHIQHRRCLEKVTGALAELRIPFTSMERSSLKKTTGHDLLVTVGGDGTMLHASHYVTDMPVLGVVSSAASIGHFCGADADNFAQVMARVASGRTQPRRLHRLQIHVGDRAVRELALNDVLFCHRNPASTSRYLVDLGGYSEEQKSSGVWIATAAGSTAAIGSAGGHILPCRSRRLQYLVREPYIGRRDQYRLLQGFINPRQRLVFSSKMDDGCIFIDGPHISYPFRFGDRLSVGLAEFPLQVFGMPDSAGDR